MAGQTLHWVLFILVVITLGIFYASHSTQVDQLMSTGVKTLGGVERGFGSFASTSGTVPPAGNV